MHAATAFAAARAYAQVGTTTAVDAADPHRLVLMLFDGAIESLSRAGAHMQAKRTALKGEAISRAIRIVEEGLKASLDRRAGGELAGTLADLYDWISHQMLLANLHDDMDRLAEAARLLGELREAWSRIPPR